MMVNRRRPADISLHLMIELVAVVHCWWFLPLQMTIYLAAADAMISCVRNNVMIFAL
jgi:hypothetical protein